MLDTNQPIKVLSVFNTEFLGRQLQVQTVLPMFKGMPARQTLRIGSAVSGSSGGRVFAVGVDEGKMVAMNNNPRNIPVNFNGPDLNHVRKLASLIELGKPVHYHGLTYHVEMRLDGIVCGVLTQQGSNYSPDDVFNSILDKEMYRVMRMLYTFQPKVAASEGFNHDKALFGLANRYPVLHDIEPTGSFESFSEPMSAVILLGADVVAHSYLSTFPGLGIGIIPTSLARQFEEMIKTYIEG